MSELMVYNSSFQQASVWLKRAVAKASKCFLKNNEGCISIGSTQNNGFIAIFIRFSVGKECPNGNFIIRVVLGSIGLFNICQFFNGIFGVAKRRNGFFYNCYAFRFV